MDSVKMKSMLGDIKEALNLIPNKRFNIREKVQITLEHTTGQADRFTLLTIRLDNNNLVIQCSRGIVIYPDKNILPYEVIQTLFELIVKPHTLYAMKKTTELSVLLIKDWSESNYIPEYSPIGVIESVTPEAIREILAKECVINWNFDDEEANEFLDQCVNDLLTDGIYACEDYEVAFKLEKTYLFQ